MHLNPTPEPPRVIAYRARLELRGDDKREDFPRRQILGQRIQRLLRAGCVGHVVRILAEVPPQPCQDRP